MERPAALSATELLCAYAAGTLSPVDVVRDVAEIVAAVVPKKLPKKPAAAAK